MRHDALGSRMKEQYENRTQTSLPRRTYTIIRLDGKAFHTYTRHCQRPYDSDLMAAMDASAKQTCADMMGAQFAYVQSDEVSTLLTDFYSPQTEAWFDGKVQKIVSVAASAMTAYFNQAMNTGAGDLPAMFDARVFTIPDHVEVENYFIWRQQDAIRNSLQMLCQSHFSHKELNGKSNEEQHEMLHSVGVNWADQPDRCKRGALVHQALFVSWEAKPAPNFAEKLADGTRRITGMIPRIWA